MEMVIRRIGKGRGQSFTDDLMGMAKYINLTKQLLPKGTGLEDIDDSHHVIIPKECKVEQLANFTKQNQVLVDGEIWDTLDNTNKAALLVHEALYKWFRNFGAKNSMRARKSVAIGFAGGEATDIKKGIPADAWECYTLRNENGSHFPGSHFWAYNDENGELIFQFDYLDGGLILTNSTLIIDQIPVSDMNDVDDVTYWLNLDSSFENHLGIALSFQRKTVDGVTFTEKQIGLGNMPDTPSQKFECAR